jgi:hypothetical protein
MSVRRVFIGCVVAAFAGLAAAPAWAATYPPVGPSPTTSVKGIETSRPVVQHSNSPLPFTGADIAAVTVAGVAAIAAGTVVVGVGRRRRGNHS